MSRSSLFKPALLAGLFACAGLASQASATDWSPIHIMPDEEFYQYRDGLSANAGQVLRYRFSTPAAATQVRVELTGANGNGNLKVFRDSENAVPACDSRQPLVQVSEIPAGQAAPALFRVGDQRVPG